jgi:pyruvate/2-oxoglutarate dehydrogenase complex dihydrolipoamide acyltransferase (E2) component
VASGPANEVASPESYVARAAEPATIAQVPPPAASVARPIPAPHQSIGRTVPFSPIRARIAENVLASKRAVADVFSVMEVDMENVHAARIAQRDAFKAREGLSLTYLPFIARATIDALRAFPAVNARIDGASLVYNDAVHLGMAVDLNEQGLVVPVIRNADDLNVSGIARSVARASSAARGGTLAATDYGGSTFTITNNGAFGTLMTAPIINQPNVAILSTDAIEERVVPHKGMIAIRRRMYLCMSWDHRAFDGSTAAKFLGHVKSNLEERNWTGQF